MNKKLYVDICIKMKDNVTYEEQLEYLALLKNDIKAKHPVSDIRLVITRDDSDKI